MGAGALDLSIVIPMRNEEDGVAELARQLRQALEPTGLAYEVVIVDDGSTDATWQRLCEAAAADSRWHVIRLKRNFGQTPAMRCGIEAARGRIIVTMDGDLQNDPADIPALLQTLEDSYDVVCGWRHKRQDRLWSRRLPSMIANRWIGALTGVRLHDYGCSLKAYRTDAIKRTPLYAEFHRFIPALSTLTGAAIAELRVRHHPRRFGHTKYTLSRTGRVVLDMLTVSLLIKFIGKPLRFFGGAAAIALTIGAACLARTWHWYVGPHLEAPQVLPGIATLCVWLAGHLLFVGLLAELCLWTAHTRPEQLVTTD